MMGSVSTDKTKALRLFRSAGVLTEAGFILPVSSGMSGLSTLQQGRVFSWAEGLCLPKTSSLTSSLRCSLHMDSGACKCLEGVLSFLTSPTSKAAKKLGSQPEAVPLLTVTTTSLGSPMLSKWSKILWLKQQPLHKDGQHLYAHCFVSSLPSLSSTLHSHSCPPVREDSTSYLF